MNDNAALLARFRDRLPPYARTLGIEIIGIQDGAPLMALDPDSRTLGRPGFVHGGALSGLLEMAAILALHAELGSRNETKRLKPVNVSIEFLRGATLQRCYAVGRVTRAGRRIANVTAEAWQTDRAKPVAEAWMNILLAEPRE
ncbi:PaaI family thioesterase [Novosphingobium sp.]|uniref:PaaI family thioesterase n=1 Tax=Novosphingobium sp. TaxID=1874826 RepID=UPI0025F18259|nr:PaaI family thioesterase [Novosphingobium sp.]